MTTKTGTVTIFEWQTLEPNKNTGLDGRFLDGKSATRGLINQLAKSKLLELTELRHGLQVTAFSHVGKLRVGDLSITILPKLKGDSLLNLVRYAYGLRKLKRFADATQAVEKHGLEELLISQLNAEIQELISRGLLRAYLPTEELLASPRGRIVVGRLARSGGNIAAALPCHHFPRTEDTVLNQVLMAGLRLAASMTTVVDLQRESRRLISLMDERISVLPINRNMMDHAFRRMNRLTVSYSSALSIIKLLFEARGIVLDGPAGPMSLPGFLFDMNAFFQALMSRFLRDNLREHSVLDEHALKGMIRYNPRFNPLRRHSPTPRPDFVVTRNGVVTAILDAKYRDLWERSLPREMLYQLVVYAISHEGLRQSRILYPTTNTAATEARIEVANPMTGEHLGEVCLRPIYLPGLERLVGSETAQGRRDRETFAISLIG